MKAKGVFICVEGLDGCGKTTQTRLLVERLEKKGFPAVYTAEPSHGVIGKFVRKHYLHGKERGSRVIEALLFAADRIEHIENYVKPCLSKGKIVVSDRYLYSSLAYQGASGLDLDWIRSINLHAIEADLELFIDVDPKTVVDRFKRKKSVMEDLETQRKVREVYLKFVNNGALVKIDGNCSKREVSVSLLNSVLGFLANMS
jgi:dTMP kinase